MAGANARQIVAVERIMKTCVMRYRPTLRFQTLTTSTLATRVLYATRLTVADIVGTPLLGCEKIVPAAVARIPVN